MNNELLKIKDFKEFEITHKSDLKGKTRAEIKNWIFIPEIYEGKYGFKKPQGEFVLRVKIEKDDVKLEDEIIIKLKKVSFLENYGRRILEIISVIAIIIIGYGYFAKKRFTKKAKILMKEYREDFSKPDSYKKLKTSIGNIITPFIPHKTIIDGIIFIANGRSLSLSGNNLAKKFGIGRVKKIYINGDLIEKEEIAKKEKYTLYDESSIKIIYEDNLTREYIYQKN